MDGTDVEIEEYEEIVGNWDQASVREGTTDFRAVSIQLFYVMAESCF